MKKHFFFISMFLAAGNFWGIAQTRNTPNSPAEYSLLNENGIENNKVPDSSKTKKLNNLGYINPTTNPVVTPCDPTCPPWTLGGNMLSTVTQATIANAILGTCDANDFILEANGIPSLWIKPTGKIGIGTSQPVSKLTLAGGDLGIDAGHRIQSNSFGDDYIDLREAEYNFIARGHSLLHLNQLFNMASTISLGDGSNINTLINAGGGTAVYVEGTTGNVGIGTITPDPNFKLSVNGSIRVKEVLVQSGWSDFVFSPGYRLEPLPMVEKYIREQGHLKDIPAAAEIADCGLNISAVMPVMMKKIEELTLYVVELEKEVRQLRVQQEKEVKK